MIEYGIVEKDEDLRSILELQKRNLPQAISQAESNIEGFVTIDHEFDLLKGLNEPYPHIVARKEGKIIGYTLVMLPVWKDKIDVLKPMFIELERSEYQEKKLSTYKYFVMGQICIDKDWRRKGVFRGLYSEMSNRMRKDHDLIITEISNKNQRSLNAHKNVGFSSIKEYHTEDGHHWHLVLKDISNEGSKLIEV